MRDLPTSLTQAERAEVLALACDLPALWKAETTTAQDRQRVARLLLERVVVEVLGKGDQVEVRLEWLGGFVSAHRVTKAVSRYDQKSDWPELKSRLSELHQGGLSAAEIAASLDREGFRPPKRAERFQAGMIHRLLGDSGLTQRRPTPDADRASLGPDEWFLSDLAAHLAIPEETMHRWRRVGWIHARKRDEPRGRWILWADSAELERLRRLRSCPRTWDNQPLVRELIIPKPRTDRSDATD